MPSQEEYLDRLLNNLTNELESKSESKNVINAENAENTENTDDALLGEMTDALLSELMAGEDSFGGDRLQSDVMAEDEFMADLLQNDVMPEDDFMADLLQNDAMPEDEFMADLLQNDTMQEDISGEGAYGDVLTDDTAELMSLLEDSQDDDLKEIQELLKKSDNNEVIEDDTTALLQEIFGEQGGEKSEKEKATEEKKMQRAAKKAAAKAEAEARKEAKRLQREEKKEAMRAAKEAKRVTREAKKKTNEGKAEEEIELQAHEDVQDIADLGLLEAEVGTSLEDILGGDTSLDGILSGETSVEDVLASQAGSGDIFADNSQVEDIFADLTSMDFLNDIVGEDGSVDISGSVGEDSLAQIMDKHEKEQKKGLFSRIINFLTEEVDEKAENENLKLSDENRDILKEMDKEGKKKKKNKKAKKGQKNQAEEDNPEEEKPDKKSKKKPKKEKKPKKVRTISEEELMGKPDRRISRRGIFVVGLMSISLGAVIILCTVVVGDYTVKRMGERAFYSGDYQTCYQNLHGRELDEGEQMMYAKSESILRIRLWMREYEMFVQEELEVEALDSLIQSLDEYPELYAYAAQWNAVHEISEVYNQMLSILADKYQLTEEQALEIANEPDDVEYTRSIMEIVLGEDFDYWNESDEEEAEEEEVITGFPETLPGELPEEEELGATEFVDNKDK